WVDEQNRLCEKSIPKAIRTRLAKALQKQFEHKGVHVPGKRGEFYFWSERQPKEDQWVLYCKKGLNGKPQKVIDPNKLSTKNRIVTLDYYMSSKTGRYLAYGLSVGGNEIATLKVMEVATGKDIETVSENASS